MYIYILHFTQGVYVLILDEYKQVYIGQSTNIKKRILNHWSNNKEFDKLIFGRVDTSVLSIDSFGFLDTTRIFVIPVNDYYKLDLIEHKLIKQIDGKYLLNRTAGGIKGLESNIALEIIASGNYRDFDT